MSLIEFEVRNVKKEKKEVDSRGRVISDYNDGQATLMREKRAAGRDIGAIPAIVNRSRRARCKKDLEKYLKTYYPNTFFRPFSKKHKKIIQKIERAAFNQSIVPWAQPRGTGKSSIAKGAATWLLNYGHRRFIPIIGSDQAAAEELLGDIKTELATNELLLEDFPEVCYPIKSMDGISNRATTQLSEGKLTSMKWTNKKVVLPTVKRSKVSGSVMVAKGILSGLRGLVHKTDAGESIRPDFFILDDPQTDKSAESPSQCSKRLAVIRKAIMGLAGHDKKISGVIPSTVIFPGDMVDVLLNREKCPEFHGERFALVEKWPEQDEDGGLWDEYKRLKYVDIAADEDCLFLADKFYLTNRAVMDKGAVVMDEELYSSADGEISAIQHAYNLLVEVGTEAFYSEYQNDPKSAAATLYDIDRHIVQRKVNSYKYREVPPQCNWLFVGADLNPSSGIHWVATAFDNHATGYICDNGLYPGNKPLWTPDNKDQTQEQAVYEGIYKWLKQMTETVYMQGENEFPISAILIDGNYMTDMVFKAVNMSIKKLRNPNIYVDRGRNTSKYRAPAKNRLVGPPGNGFHRETIQHGKITNKQYVHSADMWRMYTQKTFLLSPGTPGSISLWGSDPKKHEYISRHIVAEKLVEYVVGDTCDFYKWAITPGEHNDLLDSLVMTVFAAFAAGADNTGAGTEVGPVRRQKKKKRRVYKA